VQFYSNFDGKKEKTIVFSFIGSGKFLKECQDNKENSKMGNPTWRLP